MSQSFKQLVREHGSANAALDLLEQQITATPASENCASCGDFAGCQSYVLTSAIPQKVRLGVSPLQLLLLAVGSIGVQITTEYRVFRSQWNLCTACRRRIRLTRFLHGAIQVVSRVTLFFALMASLGTGGYMLFYNDLKPDEFRWFLITCSISTALWMFLVFVIHKSENMGYGKLGITSRHPFQCVSLDKGGVPLPADGQSAN